MWPEYYNYVYMQSNICPRISRLMVISFSINVINVKSTLKNHFVDNTEHTTFWANETFKFFSRECSVNFSRMNPRAYFPGFFMIFMESKISCGCIS